MLCCSKSTEGPHSLPTKAGGPCGKFLWGEIDRLTDRRGAGAVRGDTTAETDGRHACRHLQRSIVMQSCSRW